MKKQLHSYVAVGNAKRPDPIKGKSAQSHNIADRYNPEILPEEFTLKIYPTSMKSHIHTVYVAIFSRAEY